MTDKLREFREFRERMTRRILDEGTTNTKRFFALDTACYTGEAFPSRQRSSWVSPPPLFLGATTASLIT